MPTYHFTQGQLANVMQDAIKMFLENQRNHEMIEDQAMHRAIREILDGLDADQELAANEPGERLKLQIQG